MENDEPVKCKCGTMPRVHESKSHGLSVFCPAPTSVCPDIIGKPKKCTRAEAIRTWNTRNKEGK